MADVAVWRVDGGGSDLGCGMGVLNAPSDIAAGCGVENDKSEKSDDIEKSFWKPSLEHHVCEGPNDPKLSDGGAWRGSCVVERSEGIRAREKGGSDETGPS